MPRFFFPLSFVFFAAVLVFASTATAGQDGPLPEGAGKPAVQKVCSGCHDMETTITVRRTRNGWQDMVDDMAGRGAAGSEEELSAVIQYLTQFFGKVNVNTAPAKDLVQILGLEDKEAQAIVDYRDQNGKFKDLDQLKKVPGVNVGKLQEKRQVIAFSE